MEVGLILAVGFAVTFALTNGFHDASNAIATLVATRGATPGQAVALSAVFNMAYPEENLKRSLHRADPVQRVKWPPRAGWRP